MLLLKVGVFGISIKKQGKSVPIHPDQIEGIDKEFRENLFFEKGYGEPYGMNDEELETLCGGVMSRADLFEKSDVALLAKPVQADFDKMKTGTIHWGWSHCVQQEQITQTAIDNHLTLIAWEAMHPWSKDEDSNSIIPYLPIVMRGSDAWEESETIRGAIEIKGGVIVNPKILSFQNRKEMYPHLVKRDLIG